MEIWPKKRVQIDSNSPAPEFDKKTVNSEYLLKIINNNVYWLSAAGSGGRVDGPRCYFPNISSPLAF